MTQCTILLDIFTEIGCWQDNPDEFIALVRCYVLLHFRLKYLPQIKIKAVLISRGGLEISMFLFPDPLCK